MKTNAAVLRDGHGPFTLEELTVAEPDEHEVLVRLTASGLCHTDLLFRELPAEFFPGPQVYGHEGAGVVEATGSAVHDLAEGDHVVLSFNSCQNCPACAEQRPACCFDFMTHNMSGGRLDGTAAFTDAQGQPVGSHFFGQSSFAALTVAARQSVVKVASDLDLSILGPLGCGIQTGAGAVLNTLAVTPGSSLVVAGAGSLGLAAVMAARVAGADTIIAIDRHQSRLELAQRFGATETISGGAGTLGPAIAEATGGGADFALDTTGNAAVVRGCLEGLNNIGTLGVAGVGFGELTIDHQSLISGRRIVGVMEGDSVPAEFIPRLTDLHASGQFPYDELITTFPIADINDAEAASLSGEVIKPVLLF
ncbi:MAG: NAD(P)-dependent alcohol dehydrogenase [Acidimicrobiales bacterium]